MATQALLNRPDHIFVDAAGQLFFTEIKNYRVRKVSTDGIITTIAGNGEREIYSDSTLATETPINGITLGIFVDANNCLFFPNMTLASSGE